MRDSLERNLVSGDTSAWQVYADWLLDHSQPWAQEIAHACAGQPDRTREDRAGREILANIDGSELSWDHGVIDRAVLASEESEPDDESQTTEVLGRLLRHPAGRLVRELDLGLPPCEPGDIEWNFESVIDVIAEAGPLPRLQVLRMTRDAEHMDQPSWRRIGDVQPLWAALPELRVLEMQGSEGSDGGTPLKMGTIAATKLERLVLQSSGLSVEAIEALLRSPLPELRHLELWFGHEDYGNTCTIDDVTRLLACTGFPKLESLGLKNSEWEGALIDAVAQGPLLAQLSKLDLSMGILCTEAVDHLIAARDRFAHLKVIDVSDNFILDADHARLREALPQVVLGEAKEPWGDLSDPYSRYVSCGE